MNWYDGIAEGYDELRGGEQRKKFAVFDDYIDEDMRVLDVGFGTGLSDEYFDAEIVGVEPSKGMLDEYDGDAETHQVRAEDIDKLFQPNSFDAALCVSAAHHFDHVKQVFASMQTLVEENGFILISCFPEKIQQLRPEIADGGSVLRKEAFGREIAVVMKNPHR